MPLLMFLKRTVRSILKFAVIIFIIILISFWAVALIFTVQDKVMEKNFKNQMLKSIPAQAELLKSDYDTRQETGSGGYN